MFRSALLQNFRMAAPQLVEEFDDITDWTKSGDAGGAFAAETGDFPPGCTSAITVTPTSTGTGTKITKQIAPTIFSRDIGSIWIKSPSTIAAGAPVIFILSPDANFARRFYLVFYRAGIYDRLVAGGWRHVPFARNLFTSVGAISWDEAMNYMRIECYDTGGTFTFAKAEIGYTSRPKCIIQFDGQYITDYTVAFPYLAARGMRATHYIYDDRVSSVGRMSLAQIKELYAAGDAVSCYPHGGAQDFTTMDIATQQDHMGQVQAYLLENDMPRAAYHCAYSQGRWNSDTLVAMANLGMRTGRTTISAPVYMALPFENNITIYTREINQQVGKTLADAIVAVNYGITTGSTVAVLMHNILASPGTYDISVADFQSLIDYLYSARSAIDCVTIDEWYNGRTNPRYRSLPVARV